MRVTLGDSSIQIHAETFEENMELREFKKVNGPDTAFHFTASYGDFNEVSYRPTTLHFFIAQEDKIRT